MHRFLTASPFIDCEHPDVLAVAQGLAAGADSDRIVAERCFEFVRDEIRHSSDFQLNPVTSKASDVLRHRTGFCYAKSHLLAALLRANGIPAGLCYQRLAADDSGARFCLHGLNAVYLPDVGWYRLDPRGDKPGLASRFCPPEEVLAYRPVGPQEQDWPRIFAEPLALVTDVLTRCERYEQVLADLPDVERLPAEAGRDAGFVISPRHGLPLLTPSLSLRHLGPQDAAPMMRLNEEPSTRRWLPSHVYADLAEARARMDTLIACCEDPGHPAQGPYVLAVERRADGVLLGHVGFSPFEDEVEVSYAIAEAARGQGLGTEALVSACRWAARTFGLRQLLALTASANVDSCRLLERAGFVRIEETFMRFQGQEQRISRYGWRA